MGNDEKNGRPKPNPPMNTRAAAHFQTLASLLWPFFIGWSIVGVFVLPLLPWNLSQAFIREHVSIAGLRDALLFFQSHYDTLWIFLAAACAYAHTAAAQGLSTARRWSVTVLAIAALLCGVNAATHLPLGPLTYTEILGRRLFGTFPIAVPLLWFTVILCSRATLLLLFPRAQQWPRWQVALGGALLVLLTDLNLEIFAWKLRAWWLWYPSKIETPAWPPVQNFAAWFIVAFLTLLALRPATRVMVCGGNRFKPAVILGLLNVAALAFHVVRW